MDIDNKAWSDMSRAEKNHQIFLQQKETLDTFLERGAISKAQYDKSLNDLRSKMGEENSDL
jgi:hypothetical protein